MNDYPKRLPIADPKGCYGTELLFDLADGEGISVSIETFVNNAIGGIKLNIANDTGKLEDTFITMSSDSIGEVELVFIGRDLQKIQDVADALVSTYDLSDLADGEEPSFRFRSSK